MHITTRFYMFFESDPFSLYLFYCTAAATLRLQHNAILLHVRCAELQITIASSTHRDALYYYVQFIRSLAIHPSCDY